MDEADPREVFPVRLRRSSIVKINAIAAAHEGWTASDALRHLLALGLAAHESPPRDRIRRAAPAHSTQIDEAQWRKLQKKGPRQ